MTHTPRRPLAALILFAALGLLAGCASLTQSTGSGVFSENGAFMIGGPHLWAQDATLLTVAEGRIPGLRVATQRDDAGCRKVTLRQRAFGPLSTPAIYVDGVPVFSMCILQQISSKDVKRVEFYTGATSPGPGIMNRGYGVISIHMRDGSGRWRPEPDA